MRRDLDSYQSGFAQRQNQRRGGKTLTGSASGVGRFGQTSSTFDRQAALTMDDRLRDFQNEYQSQRWGPVRIVHNSNLMLVEHGLNVYLWRRAYPTHGYLLAIG
jgi:hypothetical protein